MAKSKKQVIEANSYEAEVAHVAGLFKQIIDACYPTGLDDASLAYFRGNYVEWAKKSASRSAETYEGWRKTAEDKLNAERYKDHVVKQAMREDQDAPNMTGYETDFTYMERRLAANTYAAHGAAVLHDALDQLQTLLEQTE